MRKKRKYSSEIEKEKRLMNWHSGRNTIFTMILYFCFNTFLITTILSIFINYKVDTIFLTNYGFAILIGISSVCFSWARNIDKNEDIWDEYERIMDCAVDSIYSAILFLLSSGFKFLSLGIKNGDGFQNIYTNPILKITFIVISGICLLFAAVRFSYVVKEILLLKIIYDDNKWKKEIDEKEIKNKLKNHQSQEENTDINE